MKNKFGWEKKDFESCLEKVSYPNKIKSNNYLQEGKFPIVSQDENLICGFWDEESDVLKIQDSVVVFGDHTRALKYVDFDFVVGADGVRVLLPKSFMMSKFLYYYLKWVNVPSLGYSRHYKLLKELNLPVPPLPTQHQIVSELDALSEIISKKKQQLEELDKLAQATFYDMFGDPVTNEKGWEVKRLGKLGFLGRGVSKNRPRNSPELLGGDTPLIQTGDIANAGMYITKYTQTYSQKGLEQSKLWMKNTLCITIAANIGKTAIMTFDACFPDSVVGFTPNSELVNVIFTYYFFTFIQKDLEENAPQVAQKNINLEILNNIKVILPPILKQNEFASKIESIESQKSLITQSIAEVQQLFDSTMDKYFN